MTESTDNKPNVLVVDDEPGNLRVFGRVFRTQMHLTLVGGGVEALAAMKAQRFDVALVDYSMPGMDGVTLLEHLTALDPSMRRILITGYGESPELQRALSQGLCERIITKPWSKAELLTLVTDST